jgi:hypothetical protein
LGFPTIRALEGTLRAGLPRLLGATLSAGLYRFTDSDPPAVPGPSAPFYRFTDT